METRYILHPKNTKKRIDFEQEILDEKSYIASGLRIERLYKNINFDKNEHKGSSRRLVQLESLLKHTWLVELDPDNITIKEKENLFEDYGRDYNISVDYKINIASSQDILGFVKRSESADFYNEFGIDPSSDQNTVEDVIMGVVDSGVDYNNKFLKDGLLKVRDNPPSYGFNFTDRFNGDHYKVLDRDGHGTAVSGVLISEPFKKVPMGIAKGGKVLSLKIIPASNNYISDACRAIMTGLTYGAKVINNSWELVEQLTVPQGHHFERIIKECNTDNCILVFAAGNDAEDVSLNYPANHDGVITVGALTHQFNRQRKSNWGDKVDIWAPGENVPTIYRRRKNGCTLTSQTSIAAPFVTGTIAILKSREESLDIEQIRNLLQNNTKKTISNGKGERFSISALHVAKSLNKLNLGTYRPKTNKINQRLIKTEIMSTKEKNCNAIIPHNPEDLESIPTLSIDLSNEKIYQLLYASVDTEGFCDFQLFGNFKGKVIRTEEGSVKYMLEQIKLKVVNMGETDGDDAAPRYKATSEEFKIHDICDAGEQKVKITIGVETLQDGEPQPYEPVIIKSRYWFEKGENSTFEVKEVKVNKLYRNGRPCTGTITFG